MSVALVAKLSRRFLMHDPGERIAVLLVVQNLPVPMDPRVWYEACALRDAGYEVVVICPRMLGVTAPEEIVEGIRVYRHPMIQASGGVWTYLAEYASALWGELRLAWKAWRRHRFRVIHICNPPDLLFLIAWPFKLLGARVVYDIHDLWPEMCQVKFGQRGVLYHLTRLAERISRASADVILVTNDSQRNVVIARGQRARNQVFVVRPVREIDTKSVNQDESLRRGRTYLVGWIGLMSETDGVDLLLEAAHDLVHRQGRDDIQFLLIGTGPAYPELTQRRDALGLRQHVEMPGWLQGGPLHAALATMDLGICCDPKNAYTDTCTMLKSLDYMAFGKAQVMFDRVEGRAAAGSAAVYLAENSPGALAEAIASLLADAPAREHIGRLGGRRLRTMFARERSVEQLLQAYARALHGAVGSKHEESVDHGAADPRSLSVKHWLTNDPGAKRCNEGTRDTSPAMADVGATRGRGVTLD